VAARALIARTLDRVFESRLRHGCLSSSFYIVLSCVGRGLGTGWWLVWRSTTMCRNRLGNQKIRGGEGPKLDYRSQWKKKKYSIFFLSCLHRSCVIHVRGLDQAEPVKSEEEGKVKRVTTLYFFKLLLLLFYVAHVHYQNYTPFLLFIIWYVIK
jgi:hypothetical protein